MAVTPDSGSRRVSDVAVSLIRTLVPYAVASLLSWIALHWNVVIPPEWSANAVVWVTLGVASGYYAAARWLERRKGAGGAAAAARLLGRWLLGGVIVQPVYSHPPTDRAFLVEPDGESRRPE